MADVPADASVVGSPAQPVKEFFRHVATLRRLLREVASRQPKVVGSGTETDTD
jgi:UDP-3-O-[3-hydroxymyristoyl] glucosamine N-acyltransferase